MALVYAERAGGHRDGTIDLGEYGLWSTGLERVSGGTLLVVGPLELDQQSWNDCSERLEMACLHALNSGHRVAVLLDTPAPETLCEDVQLMAASRDLEGDEVDVLRGVVTEDGNLEVRTPFANPWPAFQQGASIATVGTMPPTLIEPLRRALEARNHGLLLFGSTTIKEFAAIDLVIASLALTERLGRAARVMPRHRSTPSKDWDVPEAIKRLPYLPSIESAHARGYRRIIYHPNYTTAETLMQYSADTLLISETFGTADVMEVLMSTFRAGGVTQEQQLLSRVIAIVATLKVPTKRHDIVVSDLYVAGGQPLDQLEKFKDVERFILESRSIRWEDEMSRLLNAREITATGVKKAFPRSRQIAKYLAQRSNRLSAAAAV